MTQKAKNDPGLIILAVLMLATFYMAATGRMAALWAAIFASADSLKAVDVARNVKRDPKTYGYPNPQSAAQMQTNANLYSKLLVLWAGGGADRDKIIKTYGYDDYDALKKAYPWLFDIRAGVTG